MDHHLGSQSSGGVPWPSNGFGHPSQLVAATGALHAAAGSGAVPHLAQLGRGPVGVLPGPLGHEVRPGLLRAAARCWHSCIVLSRRWSLI